MIQSVITHECSKCRSLNIVKNGTDYKGGQKFHCLDCAAYGMLEPQSRSYPEFIREFVLRTYRERASMRGIERIFGIARQTLARWILEKAGAMPNLADTLETVKTDDVLELDELWSFVRTKNDKRWIWVALCRRTRQVVAYFIGDRSEKVVARYGNPSQHPTKRVAPSATSGTLTRRFYQTTLTKVSAKKAARHLTWNAGTTPCARDWLASCAKLFLSPSPTFTMKLYSSCISITTIQRGPHQLPCNHYHKSTPCEKIKAGGAFYVWEKGDEKLPESDQAGSGTHVSGRRPDPRRGS